MFPRQQVQIFEAEKRRRRTPHTSPQSKKPSSSVGSSTSDQWSFMPPLNRHLRLALRFLYRTFSVAMGCFFACFRVKNDDCPPRSRSILAKKHPVRLSILFLSLRKQILVGLMMSSCKWFWKFSGPFSLCVLSS